MHHCMLLHSELLWVHDKFWLIFLDTCCQHDSMQWLNLHGKELTPHFDYPLPAHEMSRWMEFFSSNHPEIISHQDEHLDTSRVDDWLRQFADMEDRFGATLFWAVDDCMPHLQLWEERWRYQSERKQMPSIRLCFIEPATNHTPIACSYRDLTMNLHSISAWQRPLLAQELAPFEQAELIQAHQLSLEKQQETVQQDELDHKHAELKRDLLVKEFENLQREAEEKKLPAKPELQQEIQAPENTQAAEENQAEIIIQSPEERASLQILNETAHQDHLDSAGAKTAGQQAAQQRKKKDHALKKNLDIKEIAGAQIGFFFARKLAQLAFAKQVKQWQANMQEKMNQLHQTGTVDSNDIPIDNHHQPNNKVRRHKQP